jgi:hypothetical protein
MRITYPNSRGYGKEDSAEEINNPEDAIQGANLNKKFKRFESN